MKSRMFFLGIAFLFFASSSFAMDGSSGCGPGWYILKDNSLVSSSLRATTNSILWPVSTIGMTVGSSNCTQHKLVLKEKESLHFATMNYYEIKNEAAKGRGEYLAAFSDTIGCPKESRDSFQHEVQSHFSSVFSDSQGRPEQMLEEVYKVIISHPGLVSSCSLG